MSRGLRFLFDRNSSHFLVRLVQLECLSFIIHFLFSPGHSRRRVYTIYVDADSDWCFLVFDVSINSKFSAAKFIENNLNFQAYIRIWSTLFL